MEESKEFVSFDKIKEIINQDISISEDDMNSEQEFMALENQLKITKNIEN